MNPSNQPRSDCHKAPMHVQTADEGTSCYICTQCTEVCDQYVANQPEPKKPLCTCYADIGTKHEHWCHTNQKPARNESEAGAVDSIIPDAQAEVGLLHIMDVRLNTAYQLARAATATEEGQKAIDFFYHVHLNGYTDGIDLLQKTERDAAVETAIEEARKHLYTASQVRTAILRALSSKTNHLMRIAIVEDVAEELARLQPPTAGEGESV